MSMVRYHRRDSWHRSQAEREVVMVGAHLDSWRRRRAQPTMAPATVVAMEVMRILTACKSSRGAPSACLWTGEEQGLFGSAGYVRQHFGYVPLSTAPDQLEQPDWLRKPAGPLVVKPEQPKISGYFNVDNGTGKSSGFYLQENAAVAPIFAQWMEPLKDLGVTTITDRNTTGTDHDRSMRSGSRASSSFRTVSTTVRAASLEHATPTNACSPPTWRRRQPWRLSSYTTPPCATRCCAQTTAASRTGRTTLGSAQGDARSIGNPRKTSRTKSETELRALMH